jgi:transposase
MQQNLQAIASAVTFPNNMVIGLDLGDRWSRYCMLDNAGSVEEEDRVRSTDQALEARFGTLPAMRFVIETGTHSPWVSRLLKGMGHSVVVANARKLRMIYESNRKNDRLDARMLARLGRADVELLAPVRHRSAKAQADLAVVRGRDALVAARTQLINACRGTVKAMGGRLPKCTTAAMRASAKLGHSAPRERSAAAE